MSLSEENHVLGQLSLVVQIIKKGRWGEFKACSNYPKCHYIKKEPKKTEEDK